MPLRRLLRGRAIKRTRRRGNDVLVTFRGEPKGTPGPRLVLPLADYLDEVQMTFHPGRRRGPAPP
jgi:hypothetical protein